MSKMTDYQSGREDGLLLSEQLVKDGGLERLQEEIKYRGITGVHTQLAKKELEKASEQIKMNTLDTVLLLAVSTIRDEFDFGAKRLQRLINRMEKKASCLIGDMATWEDFRKQMEERIKLYGCQWMTETGCDAHINSLHLMAKAILEEGEDIEMCKEQCCIGCTKTCGYRCVQANRR